MKLIKKDFERMKDKQARDNPQVNQKKKSNLFLSAACAALLMIEGIVYGQGSANNTTNANKPTIEYSYRFINLDFYTQRSDGSIDYDGFIIDKDGQNKLANAMTEIIRKIDYESADNRYKEEDGRINRKLLKSCDDYSNLISNPALLNFWKTVEITKKEEEYVVNKVELSAYKERCEHFLRIDEVQACINDCLPWTPSEKNPDSENPDSESWEKEKCYLKECYFLNSQPGYNSDDQKIINEWIESFVRDVKNSNDQNAIDKKCSDFKLLIKNYEKNYEKDKEEYEKDEEEAESSNKPLIKEFNVLVDKIIKGPSKEEAGEGPGKNGEGTGKNGEEPGKREEVFLKPHTRTEREFFSRLLYPYNKFCPTKLVWKGDETDKSGEIKWPAPAPNWSTGNNPSNRIQPCLFGVDPACNPYIPKPGTPGSPTYIPPSYGPPFGR